MTPAVNPFTLPGQWCRANLHCHTNLSDGDISPQERVTQYARAGYDILALTDHETTNDIAALDAKGMLLISGIEVHPPKPGRPMYHFVALGVPHPCTAERDDDTPAQERIDALRRMGAEIVYAHPRWSGHNARDMMAMNGWSAFEVYNTVCNRVGRPESDAAWDDLCEAGILAPALATDDTHRGPDTFFFRGWTMLRMADRTEAAFMEALRRGAFYATCGPEVTHFGVADGKVSIECSPAKEVRIFASAPGGMSHFAAAGETIQRIEQPLNEKWHYVRVEVIDEQNRKAWLNPVAVNEK